MTGNTPAFRPKRIALLIGAVILLNACSSVQQGVEGSGQEGADSPSTRAVSNRSTAARVSLPVSEQGDVGALSEFPDIWSRIGAGLQFSMEYDNPRIQEQLAFYRDNPNFLKTVTERASPFIYAIVEEVDRRGLPTEIALLPIVESAFNPNAVSPGNSVGLWQINSATAPTLGLKRDWWYDGSRDPIASTRAALDYLTQLHGMFEESWLLSLAAYNTGPGNVRKAIDRNRSRDRDVDYWSLNLPSVTEDFVPKLIALSRLVAQPDHYGMELADVPNAPQLAPVDVGYQLDLALAASLAGLEPQTLYQLNPGFRQWATHPDGPYSLLLPLEVVDTFMRNVEEQGERPNVTWDRYIVQRGDTLNKIARQFRTQVSVLQQVNNISGSKIIAGDSLLIPRSYNAENPITAPSAPEYPVATSRIEPPVPPQAPALYRVRAGDSLWKIANRYKVTVAQLRAWNNLGETAVIKPGQQLSLQADAAIAKTGAANAAETAQTYVVKSGDTLAAIARRFGVTVGELTTLNGIRAGDLIHPGQQLLLAPGESQIN